MATKRIETFVGVFRDSTGVLWKCYDVNGVTFAECPEGERFEKSWLEKRRGSLEPVNQEG